MYVVIISCSHFNSNKIDVPYFIFSRKIKILNETFKKKIATKIYPKYLF